jgi:alkanesulfonate monooxygenase SsuD/methylene tetrahydromethanopterin reductase-like flavin-dependent oxidoreductase (luciferase family)
MMRFDLRRARDTTSTTDLVRAAIDMVAWADTRGCAIVTLSEHHASPDGYLPSPMMVASAMAARTQHVHFMIAAALLPFYDPIRLAEDMAVLDHISTGRVSYVLGLGYRPEEFAMYGVPMADRGRIADRKLGLLLAAKTGQPVEHEGRTIQVTPAPSTLGGPRVAWGGQSVAAARRAARHGLDFIAQSNHEDLEPAYRDECARLGRAPGACTLADPTLPLTTFVAGDVDAAWAELGPYLLHDATTYAGWNEGDDRTASLSRGSTVAALRAEQGAHRIMSVDEAVAHLGTAGILTLHPLCGGIPPDLAWPYLRRVVDEVEPRVAF